MVKHEKKFLKIITTFHMGWIEPKKHFTLLSPLTTGEAKQREERLERGRRGSRYGYVS
jgi:hypothetical protein